MACCWCNKAATQKSFSLKTSNGEKYFCSELCFSQCRRANFKRNKTCDWCRHIRHTVNYVDFQDGEHQLQFCSDKCLNQYKMNIFCKETEAHLQLHPHLAESAGGLGPSGAGLITPDLWLRDCRSESPASDRSSTPPLPPPVECTVVERKEEAPREKKKTARNKRSKVDHPETTARKSESVSAPKPPPGPFPPPLLPLNGAHMNLLHPNLRPEHPLSRPPFLGYFPPPHLFPPDHPLFRGGPRFPPVMKPHFNSPSTPPPMTNPPPPRLPPPLPHSFLPPVTILIPYPIPLPIPFPIPIPIPIPMDKLKTPPATATKEPEPEVEKAEKPEEKKSKCAVAGVEPQAKASVPPATPSATSTPVPRPLRKRRRVADLPQGGESVTKRKTVHV